VNQPWHLPELKMFQIEAICRDAIASQGSSGAALWLVSTGLAYCRGDVYLELRNKTEPREIAEL
jgi:hypothetical protein